MIDYEIILRFRWETPNPVESGNLIAFSKRLTTWTPRENVIHVELPR
jgi:hypothetical protein